MTFLDQLKLDLQAAVEDFLATQNDPIKRMIEAEAAGEFVGQDLRSLLATARALACDEAVKASSPAEVSINSGVSPGKVQSLMATARQHQAVIDAKAVLEAVAAE